MGFNSVFKGLRWYLAAPHSHVHLFLFSYISSRHLPATHRTNGCLFGTQTNKSVSIDLITTLVARGQGVELQYKAGEQMSLRHIVESSKSSIPWVPDIRGIRRPEQLLPKLDFKMYGPIPTPTATYIIMWWTGAPLLWITLRDNKRCPCDTVLTGTHVVQNSLNLWNQKPTKSCHWRLSSTNPDLIFLTNIK